MVDSLKKLEKLKRLTLAELRGRSAQKVAAFAERCGWSSATELPTDQAMLEMIDPAIGDRQLLSAEDCLQHFRARNLPKFFGGFADREATISELRRRWPNGENEIIDRANRILEGRFDLLGFHDLSFGTPIDWHLEPVSGKRAPLLHWSRLDFLDAELAGDKKIVWELNRQQYFVILGQAYWLTGDERYAQTFVDHISSWMDQNPPKLGINWASSLEIAFRSISWLWAFYFFKDSPLLSSSVHLRALKFLYLNGRHLETYLSTYFSPNTHLTGEALGLFYLGTLLPELKLAARWRETGRQVLIEQLPRHVRSDGTYFEQSSYYHRYTTDIYSHFLILSRLNIDGNQAARGPQPGSPAGMVEESKVEEKLALLLDHLMYIQRPDGTTPFFGDDDGGRLIMLDQRAANDFHAALSTGAALFGRGDYKYVAREAAEETLWLLGADALLSFDKLQAQRPANQSIAFAEGGYYVMRDGWTTTANYLLFDCGPHGQDNCGHAHADALAFEVAANGRPLLVDPGTYTYTASRELRNWFRSSLAHNTLTVDGESSSVPDGPFSWKSIARAEATTWISRDRFDHVEGKHDGYLRLAAPVTHARSILFLKNDYWIVRDRVASNAEHLYALWFHLNPDVNGRVDAEQAVVISDPADEAALKIAAFAGDGHWGWEEAWVSHCYGEREPAPVCVFSANAADEEFVTFLLPGLLSVAGAKRPQVRVNAVETIGGRAFEVTSETAVDLVMIRNGKRVETARMASDFDWTWARFSSAGASVPEELVLLGGQTLELEGQEILKSERRINYLVGTRVGDSEFRISDCEFRNGDPEAEIHIRNPKSEIRNS